MASHEAWACVASRTTLRNFVSAEQWRPGRSCAPVLYYRSEYIITLGRVPAGRWRVGVSSMSRTLEEVKYFR
ncbi:hypothetical protein EVAR_36486_1 [Eumeta japonica]|uniref:Uncharacterized protein n=1 Tax=Eumeta variegata TaxID=151549 RepID=A0A4C1WTS5_EUMVA|nr:hypothetical protein EVAR_36486_1 [Eumeta japonica]